MDHEEASQHQAEPCDEPLLPVPAITQTLLCETPSKSKATSTFTEAGVSFMTKKDTTSLGSNLSIPAVCLPHLLTRQVSDCPPSSKYNLHRRHYHQPFT